MDDRDFEKEPEAHTGIQQNYIQWHYEQSKLRSSISRKDQRPLPCIKS